MNTRRAFCIATFIGTTLGSAVVSLGSDADLLRIWSAPSTPVHERAKAVNQFFTNGTPIRKVVALLGSNYGVMRPFSSVWIGPGPEPRKTCSLLYDFGNDTVVINTSADIAGDPLTGEFTGAGSSRIITNLLESTNVIRTGGSNGAAEVKVRYSSMDTRERDYLKVGPAQMEWSLRNTGRKTGWLYFHKPGSNDPIWEFAPCPRTNLADIIEKDLTVDFIRTGDPRAASLFKPSNPQETGVSREFRAILVSEGLIVLARLSHSPRTVYAIRLAEQRGTYEWGSVKVEYVEMDLPSDQIVPR